MGRLALSERRIETVAGPRLWLVIVAKRPSRDRRALRELMRALREHGARRVSMDVFLVRAAEGLSERLVRLAEEIDSGGGRIIVADARVVPNDAPGGAAK